MPYEKHTWTTGETITASKMNNIEDGIAGSAGSQWDAVIRLVHTNNTADDVPSNLTPSIVSGTFADLIEKLSNGGCPRILVEYYHPFGYHFAVPMAYITYVAANEIFIVIAGHSLYNNNYKVYGTLSWSRTDILGWD